MSLVWWFRAWILRKAVAIIAEKIAENEPVARALVAYWTERPLVDVVKAYTAATSSARDDRALGVARDIEAAVKTESLRTVANRYLSGVMLPDLDGDPTNDISLPEAIDSVAHAVVKMREQK